MKDRYMFMLVLLLPSLVFCHRINIFATVEGNRIYTQSYASDGGKIKGGVIEVFDGAGNKLLSGQTDSLGAFSFVVPKKTDLKIVVHGGMGHRAETTLSAGDLPEIKTDTAEWKQKQEHETRVPRREAPVIDTAFLKKTVEDIMDAKLHPIMMMLAEQREKRITFTEIVGGIGYIFGIMGVIMFFASRRKNG
jgi:nickel transport protein